MVIFVASIPLDSCVADSLANQRPSVPVSVLTTITLHSTREGHRKRLTRNLFTSRGSNKETPNWWMWIKTLFSGDDR